MVRLFPAYAGVILLAQEMALFPAHAGVIPGTHGLTQLEKGANAMTPQAKWAAETGLDPDDYSV